MHLFTRSVVTSGPLPEIMAYATEITTYVNEKTDLGAGLWSGGFGTPVGTLVWSARVDGLAGVQAIETALMGDDGYHTLLARGRDYLVGPAVDNLAQPIHGELGDRASLGSVVVITSVVIANGKYAEAIGWGTEMAVLGESITGQPTLFMMDGYGTFGHVTFANIYADAAAADAARDAVNGDARYMEKLGAIGDLFVPASGHRSMATRVG